MKNIIPFPKQITTIPNGYPRQQLFLAGKISHGPIYDNKFTYYYLRRNIRRGENTNKEKTWSLKTFQEQKETCDLKLIEIDVCNENEVIEMLEKWNLFSQVTYKKLHRMGWKGKIKKNAIIVNLKQLN